VFWQLEKSLITGKESQAVKGRRKEMIREELRINFEAFGVTAIHSE
jgi:hypothetical protein